MQPIDVATHRVIGDVSGHGVKSADCLSNTSLSTKSLPLSGARQSSTDSEERMSAAQPRPADRLR
jgi:hypothetical protein